GKYGVSNPRAFVVGTHAELVEKEPNNTPEQALEVPLGSVVNGQSAAAADQDFFKFTGKKGQRVLVDCWAYRIDSRMDASLVLYDASGKELARNRDTNRRDPLLDFTVPADGVYFVELHDFLYGGSNENFYRLSIGTGAYLDYIFPPAGVPGSNDHYTLYGRNLPGGQPTKMTSSDGKPLESLGVQIALPADQSVQNLETGSVVEPDESGIDGLAYRLPTSDGLTNSVLLGFATAPVVAEQEPNDEPAKAQAATVPCELVGQFYPLGDRDWFTIQAKAGEALWMEVFSQRLGLPTDPYLLVQQVTKDDKGQEQVKDIAGTDDFMDNPPGNVYEMKTDDPAFRFVAPADGTYRILVRNLSNYARPDPRLVYRLAIHPAKPDFRVVAKPRLLPFSPDPNVNPPTVWSPLVRKGGAELIDVMVFRREGFDGEVTVSVEGLPAGVTSAPVTIAPGQTAGAIVLSAAENAAESTALVTILGKAKIGDTEVVRPARSASMVWGGRINQITPRSRLTRNLAVAVSGSELFPFFVDAGQNLVLEMCKAGKVQVPLKLVRRGDFKGNVVLTPSTLPPNVRPSNVTLDPNATSGNLEINLPPNVPPGTYSFSVLGTTQISYSRNPEAVKAATDRKAVVDKVVGELDAASKASLAAKAAAEKKAAESDEAAKKSHELAQAAEKAAQEAAAKAKAAADAKAAAEKAAVDADAQAKAAAEAKAAALQAATAAEAKLKEAAAVQQAVAKAVTDATNKAKPANINLAAPSPTVTLKVTSAPITLNAIPSGSAIKQGGSLELPVTINRLYSYADAVQIKAKLPAEAKGLKIADLSIAAGQSEAKLVVQAAADAAPGTYSINIQAVSKYNGQDLPVAQDVAITVN
ncbi:MAG TPA: PPC domain-containing protein, partial [Pirellulales bacterium]|nr:PPC domain-containing protein [Pirellulales bacterium]